MLRNHALDSTRTVALAVSPWTPAWPHSAEQAGALHPPEPFHTFCMSPLVALRCIPPSELVSCVYLPFPPHVRPRKSPPVHLAPPDSRASLGRRLSFSLLFESWRLLRPAPEEQLTVKERLLGVAASGPRPAWSCGGTRSCPPRDPPCQARAPPAHTHPRASMEKSDNYSEDLGVDSVRLLWEAAESSPHGGTWSEPVAQNSVPRSENTGPRRNVYTQVHSGSIHQSFAGSRPGVPQRAKDQHRVAHP